MRNCAFGNALFRDDENIRRYATHLVFDTVRPGRALPAGPLLGLPVEDPGGA